MNHATPPYLYCHYEGMRCRLWQDASGERYAECWDETAQAYLPESRAAVEREGSIMSPEALAESLRRFPVREA